MSIMEAPERLTPVTDRHPQRIETLEDASAWIYAHDARIDAQWKSQDGFNERIERSMTRHGDRISALERKMMWVAGLAAGIGGALGSVMSKFIG